MGELGKAIILGIVEGLTEFIPVSSTGHLLLCEKWMSIHLNDPFWKMFTVFIQIGAILAVVVYFRHKIVQLLSGSISGNTVAQRVVMMVIVLHGGSRGVQNRTMECEAAGRKLGYAAEVAAFRLRCRAVSRFGSSTVSKPIAGRKAQT